MNNKTGFDIFLDFAKILIRRKRLIFLGTLIPTAICIVVVMVSESTYKSEALVNPPKSQNGSPLQALASASGMGDALGSLLGSGSEEGLNDCVSILESTRFASLMIKRFDLETRYKFKEKGKDRKYFYSDVLKVFHRYAEYELTEENAIRLTARDKSPERAKEMTDYMIYLLDSLYTDIQQTTIKHRLAYVDARLAMTLGETKLLEDSLIRFQNKHNFLVPEAQIKLILENTTRTELKLETVKEEMALEGALRGKTGGKYKDLESEKRLLEQNLQARLHSAADSNSLMLPTHSLPLLATEYFRLERAYTVRLGVYKYLVQQVEVLKLDANKNVQVISVIDPAWVNNKRVSPKRRVAVEATFLISFVLCTVLAALLSLWEKYRLENPQVAVEIRNLRSQLLKL